MRLKTALTRILQSSLFEGFSLIAEVGCSRERELSNAMLTGAGNNTTKRSLSELKSQ